MVDPSVTINQTKKIVKAICFRWPLLLVLISCSSQRKQFYYFDHQQYRSTEIRTDEVEELKEIGKTKADTPVFYASSQQAFDVPTAEVLSKNVLKKPLISVKDSIPGKKLDKRKKFKKFGITAIALSPAAAIVSFFYWPVGIVIAGVAIVFSVLAFWSNKKLLGVISLLLALLAMLVALIVMDSPILQHGNGFGMGSII